MPIYQQIQSLLDQMTSSTNPSQGIIPGIAVTVQLSNQPSITLTSGLENVQNNIPVNPANLFEIGSNTKTFIATLVMQLVEQKQLLLENTLQDVIMNYENPFANSLEDLLVRYPFLRSITIHALLNHTSVLKEYQKTKAFKDIYEKIDRSMIWTPYMLLLIAAAEGPEPQPLPFYHYTNTNYVALAMVLEAVTNRPHSKLLHQNIIDKLSLQNTYYLPSDAKMIPPSNMTNGYAYYDPKTKEPKEIYQTYLVQQPVCQQIQNYKNTGYNLVTVISPTITPNQYAFSGNGDGGIISNSSDLNKWTRALFMNQLLNKATLDLMLGGKNHDGLIPTGENFGDITVKYGLGIYYFQKTDGTKLWAQLGNEDGYQAGALYFPQHGISFTYTFTAPNDNAAAFLLENIIAILTTPTAKMWLLPAQIPLVPTKSRSPIPFCSIKKAINFLFSLLGDGRNGDKYNYKTPQLSDSNILKILESIDHIQQKLIILEETFKLIKRNKSFDNSSLYTRTNYDRLSYTLFFLEPRQDLTLSETQCEHIRLLQNIYLGIVDQFQKNYNDPDSLVALQVKERTLNSELINFNPTHYEYFKKNKSDAKHIAENFFIENSHNKNYDI